MISILGSYIALWGGTPSIMGVIIEVMICGIGGWVCGMGFMGSKTRNMVATMEGMFGVLGDMGAYME